MSALIRGKKWLGRLVDVELIPGVAPSATFKTSTGSTTMAPNQPPQRSDPPTPLNPYLTYPHAYPYVSDANPIPTPISAVPQPDYSLPGPSQPYPMSSMHPTIIHPPPGPTAPSGYLYQPYVPTSDPYFQHEYSPYIPQSAAYGRLGVTIPGAPIIPTRTSSYRSRSGEEIKDDRDDDGEEEEDELDEPDAQGGRSGSESGSQGRRKRRKPRVTLARGGACVACR